MPTYEFACSDCGHRIERFLRIDDEPPSLCDVCGGKLRKVFHPAGIVFRGSGFYKTDSRTASKTKTGDGTGSKKEAAATSSSDTSPSSSKDAGSKGAGSSGSKDAGSSGSKDAGSSGSRGAAPREKSA